MADGAPLLTPAGTKGITVKCQVCGLKPAQYTCPTCNLRYCSLNCFKSEAHSSCSETFYKESLLSEVQNRKDVDPEEKRKVMDMLRRLEDAELEGLGGEDDGEEIEDEVDGDKLRAALQGLDIDAIPPGELLAMLSPEQQKEFQEILKDPKRAEELLLANEEPTKQFWWEMGLMDEETMSSDVPSKPEVFPPEKLLPVPNQDPLDLSYNLAAIVLGYALYCRMVASEESPEERQRMLAQLLPFLVEKSTLKYGSLEEALEGLMSRVRSDVVVDRTKLMLLLLDDLKLISKPSRVQIVNQEDISAATPNVEDKVYLLLSDLYTSFTSPLGPAIPGRKKLYPLAGPKILFYLSNLPRISRQSLPHDIEKYQGRLRRENEEKAEVAGVASNKLSIHSKVESGSPGMRVPESGRAKIEEIP